MNKIKTIIGIITIFFISCNSNTNTKQEISKETVLEGEVFKIVVDHVIKHRDWCRFSSIYYHISLYNASNDTLTLNIASPIDGCATDIHNPNLWYVNSDTIMIVAIDNMFNDNLQLVPYQKDTIIVKLLCRLKASSLKDILNEYDEFINSNFIIKSIGFLNNDTVIFKKTNKFNYIYMLDDEFVFLEDSIKMNQKQLSPNYKH